ncbi:hypothetical protein CEXT_595521 [Caerostris extrusa]|uniref:Ribosomal protein S19 n=1 Tax=Caerostris extrusa TaxID=172846 RepID=A0AAV4Y2B2_CAEEX|nr:hypothetical protein CEXT_595521 [Caerostris extrusa]
MRLNKQRTGVGGRVQGSQKHNLIKLSLSRPHKIHHQLDSTLGEVIGKWIQVETTNVKPRFASRHRITTTKWKAKNR